MSARREIVWEDPPPDVAGGPRHKGRWQLVTEQLQEHPGKWARVMDEATFTQVSSAHQRLKKYGCETRFTGTGMQARVENAATMALYARWPEDAA